MTPDESVDRGIARKQVDEIVAVMLHSHGVDVACYDETFLAKSAEKRRNSAIRETHASYLERLAADRAEGQAFHRSLRVVYSEFFRNPLAFALLEQLILPVLIDFRERSRSDELRIWSAGCAAGQEAWSVAILLDELTAARGNPLSYRIFATDLSEPDLNIARNGVYPAAAVGNVRLRHLDRCFARQGDAYVLKPRLRDHVDFSSYDLLDAVTTCPPTCIYGDFDLVLCNNVLLYYRPNVQLFILDKIRRSLAPRGYLVTDDTERQIVENTGGFRSLSPPAAVFEQRRKAKGG